LGGIAKSGRIAWIVRWIWAVALRAQIGGNLHQQDANENKQSFHINIEWSRNEYAF
jgi:hypothetical protein